MTDIFKEHFINTKNVGKIKKPDAIAKWKSGFCGDIIEVFLKIEDGKIVDIKHLCSGCWALIGSASILTEHLKGREVVYAKNFTEDMYKELIGPIEDEKSNCVSGPYAAVKQALAKLE